MLQREQLVSTHRLHGAELRVFTTVAQEPARGVIFAVHGFRGDHHGLARIVDHLENYTVIVPDLPGFGASTSMASMEHDVDGYAQLLDALADELKLDASIHLLGHSFGSIVAAKLATVRPFASLLLLNPISEPALDSSQALLAKITSAYYAVCAKLPASIAEPPLRSSLFSDAMSLVMTKSKDPQIRRYVREQHRWYFGGFHSRSTLAQAYRASISSTVGHYSPRDHVADADDRRHAGRAWHPANPGGAAPELRPRAIGHARTGRALDPLRKGSGNRPRNRCLPAVVAQSAQRRLKYAVRVDRDIHQRILGR
ncbi:alpha/beta fold hydrolase [Glutamicibacter halophytocola]|uniref:alpha/beta hydrolase n=1 Tax=Glutamicibacter halophytocola TaxID=1933880 RepID=UPI0032190985